MANHNDWQARADKQLWSLVTRQLRAAERHMQALADDTGLPSPLKRRLDRAQAFAALAHARELARFCYSSEQRRLAMRAISRTAKALWQAAPDAS
jgi:hypothetical protein